MYYLSFCPRYSVARLWVTAANPRLIDDWRLRRHHPKEVWCGQPRSASSSHYKQSRRPSQWSSSVGVRAFETTMKSEATSWRFTMLLFGNGPGMREVWRTFVCSFRPTWFLFFHFRFFLHHCHVSQKQNASVSSNCIRIAGVVLIARSECTHSTSKPRSPRKPWWHFSSALVIVKYLIFQMLPTAFP